MKVLADVAVVSLSLLSSALWLRSDVAARRGAVRASLRALSASTAFLVAAIVVAVAQTGLGR